MAELVAEDHEFVTPIKEVLTNDDMKKWEKSEAYQEYVGFIIALNNAVKGKPLTVQCPESEGVEGILKVLSTMNQWVSEIPPIEQPQRFGNKAFRSFFERLKLNGEILLHDNLDQKFHRAIPEISVYLLESVGNPTRIDYGTGHEMSFVMFLCCLFKIGVFAPDDKVAVVCRVFNRYLDLMRKLQLVYRMEPAGSHGVWSLDDYQFVPFIWGSAQLIAHPRIEPKSFLDEDVVRSHSKDHMFLGCIQFILSVKTGPFAEHSNQLWNISAVPTWSKINLGLVKMYKNEILAKFPVIQHVRFGSLLPIRPATHTEKLRMPPPPIPTATPTKSDSPAKPSV